MFCHVNANLIHCLGYELVKANSVCAGPYIPLRCVESEFDCAVICQGNAHVFVYGQSCNDGNKYKCRCEIQATENMTCTIVDDLGFNLYKYHESRLSIDEADPG